MNDFTITKNDFLRGEEMKIDGDVERTRESIKINKKTRNLELNDNFFTRFKSKRFLKLEKTRRRKFAEINLRRNQL